MMVYDHEQREEVPVSGHKVGEYTQGFSELGLWVRLAVLGLNDLSRQTQLKLDQLATVPTVLGLPSGYHWERARQSPREGEPDDEVIPWPDLVAWYQQGLFAKIYGQCGVSVPPLHEIHFGDEAGIATLLVRASRLLERGHEWVIVGSIDATSDIPMARALSQLGLLKTAARPIGQMPGEAACFLLLTRSPRGQSQGLPMIEGLGVAHDRYERCGDTRACGEGYAQAIVQALESFPQRPRRFYVDLNGESTRAYDWGSALVRLPSELRELPVSCPLESFGAVRASYGVISSIYCTFMFERVPAARGPTLVVCGSDDGRRAAFFVTRG